MLHVVCILNDNTTAILPDGMTRNEAWEYESITDAKLLQHCRTRPPPKLHSEPTIGQLCFAKTFPTNKMQSNGEPCIYLGKREHNDGCIVLSLQKGRVYSSKNVSFRERLFPCRDAALGYDAERFAQSPSISPSSIPTFGTYLSTPQEDEVEDSGAWIAPAVDDCDLLTKRNIKEISENLGLDFKISDTEEEKANPPPRTNTRIREPSQKALENIVNSGELLKMKAVATTIYPIADPVTRTEAMNSPQRDEWIEAEKAEMLAIHSTRTYIDEFDGLTPSERSAHLRTRLKDRLVAAMATGWAEQLATTGFPLGLSRAHCS